MPNKIELYSLSLPYHQIYTFTQKQQIAWIDSYQQFWCVIKLSVYVFFLFVFYVLKFQVRTIPFSFNFGQFNCQPVWSLTSCQFSALFPTILVENIFYKAHFASQYTSFYIKELSNFNYRHMQIGYQPILSGSKRMKSILVRQKMKTKSLERLQQMETSYSLHVLAESK